MALKDRRALDDSRIQRRKLAVDLMARSGFESRTALQQIQEDIIGIEAGLSQLARRRPNLPEPFAFQLLGLSAFPPQPRCHVEQREEACWDAIEMHMEKPPTCLNYINRPLVTRKLRT